MSLARSLTEMIKDSRFSSPHGTTENDRISIVSRCGCIGFVVVIIRNGFSASPLATH
jgi:hypothetical protein